MKRYNLEIREAKQFELYNDLEVGDRVELSILLKFGEGPKKAKVPVKAEKLWVEIESFIFEAQNIYRSVIMEQPLFLKELKKGDRIDFAPENVFKATRKKPQPRVKDLNDFVYTGKRKEYEEFQKTIRQGEHTYAIDPSKLVIRCDEIVEGSVSITDLTPETRKDLEKVIETYEKIQPDKYHVRIDRAFVKKCLEKLRNQSSHDETDTTAAIIRVSDRTFIPFNTVRKILKLSKSVLIYLDAPGDRRSLYFKSENYEGFIDLTSQSAESIIFDVIER